MLKEMLDTLTIGFLLFITDAVAILTVTITPPSTAEILVNSPQLFTCTITVQANWRTVQFFDSSKKTESNIVQINNDGLCGFFISETYKDDYEVGCGNAGEYHLTIKSVTELYNSQTVKCTAQYGPGNKSDVFVSDSSVISVIIPLTNIAILPSTATLDVERDTYKEFKCSATSRPLVNIVWMKSINEQKIIITPSDGGKFNDTTIQTYLNYTGKEADEGAFIFCIGKYNGSDVESDKIRLRIIYAPDTNPSVKQIPAGNIVAGKHLMLTCNVTGGNPLPVLSWNCTGTPTSNTTGNKSFSSVAFTVNKTYNDMICTCYVSDHPVKSYRPSVHHLLVVFYQPDGKFVIQETPTTDIFAGNNVTLTCSLSGGNPLATLTWNCSGTNVNYTIGRTAFYNVTFTVDKMYNNRICECSATHVIPSFNRSLKHNLVVYYAPDNNPTIQMNPNENITVGDHVTLTCSVSGGNPLASLSWNCTGQPMNLTTGNTASLRIAFTVNKTFNHMVCSCSASHSVDSYKPNVQQALIVYYGPGIPEIKSAPMMPWFESNSSSLFCTYDEGNPKAAIRWTRNNQREETNNDKPTFEFGKLTSDDNTIKITCTVYNSYSQNLSTIIYLDVQYVPYVMVEDTYILTNESNSVSLSCKSRGNPLPLVKWTLNGKEINYPTENISILTIENINRTDSGNYQCEANSYSDRYGNLKSTADAQVDVNYAPDVTVTKNVSNIVEKTDLTLTCIAAGKPSSYAYRWTHTFAGDVIRVFNSNTKTLFLNKISYQDIGKYECSVHNGIEDRHGILQQTNNTIVEVQFKPAFVFYDKVTTGKGGGNVSISVDFISFPDIDKTVTWRNSTDNSIVANDSNIFMTFARKSVYVKIYNTTVSFDKHGYSSSLHFPNFDENQDGFYNLEVSNIIGVNNKTMRLVFSDRPEPPKLFSASVIGSTFVTLTWKEGFNGGNNQTFIITYWKMKSVYTKSVNVSERNDKIYIIQISDLIKSTSYMFHITAKNEEGYAFAVNNTIVISTKDISETENSIIGPVAGAVGGIFAAGLIVVVIIVFRRKYLATSGKETDRKNLTFGTPGGDDEDGLKDNELYVSADENFTVSTPTTGDVYAVVKKPGDQKAKATLIQETVLYSEVEKKKDEENTGEISKNVKIKQTGKHITKGKLKKENRRMEDVYENITERNTQHTSKNRNKDGLVYADIVFKEDGQRKFIIRGIENKTAYADIDLNLKADPLPSDESDEEKNDVTENGELNGKK